MTGGVSGETTDRVSLAINGRPGGGGEKSEAEFTQQRERPFVVGQASGCVAFEQALGGGAESSPIDGGPRRAG
jgi:hypothetical protein